MMSKLRIKYLTYLFSYLILTHINEKTWRVAEFDHIIGASGRIETRFVRVEMSADTIPITVSNPKSNI
jgi:hypothetical protein